MTREEVGNQFLNTSIDVMQRNRTLIFAINLIAGLIIIVIFLETMSFDAAQQNGYLLRYRHHCNSLKAEIQGSLNPDELKVVEQCYELKKISGIIVSKIHDNKKLINASLTMASLSRIQNSLDDVNLEKAHVTPLGFGLNVPRNDLIIICGLLMVILYLWLAFSYRQHARIIEELSNGIYENDWSDEKKKNTVATFNRLVEINFMFRTDKKSVSSIFVKLLIYAAPISMWIAFSRDAYSIIIIDGDYGNYILRVAGMRLILEVIIATILCFIGYDIKKSDGKSNKVFQKNERSEKK